MTVYDALKRASAQQFGGEAQTDDLDDEDMLALYLQYAQEGFYHIWQKLKPIDTASFPSIVYVACPTLNSDYSLDAYDTRVFDALSDYVTWRMFGTGNATKQARGDWFYGRYMESLGMLAKDASWDAYRAAYGGGETFTGVWDW